MSDPSVGYLIVYHIEIALLFATLLAIGPLVRDPTTRLRQGRTLLPTPVSRQGA